VRIVSPAGEQMREYLVREDALIAEEGIIHHFYFLGRRLDAANGTIALIMPRHSRQVIARVTEQGTETISLNGERREAVRLRVEHAEIPARDVWLDQEGRVMKVEVPDRRFVAERIGS
jgi:hypothetical protein